ncbi:MAG: hypothetical protein ACRCVJ_16945 [Clostridium sp.]|uniref:hypothetical protein n=1 Tax=Clostridium sp. TaxID=1506 RepID=UPI003F3F1EB5
MIREYIATIVKTKDKLTMANVNDLIEHQIVDKTEIEHELQYLNAYKLICSKPNLAEKRDELEGLKGDWYKVSDNLQNPFLDLYSTLEEGRDYIFSSQGLVVKKTPVDKAKKNNTKMIEAILKDKKVLDRLNKAMIQAEFDKRANGTIRKWEMDSRCSYEFGYHELDSVNLSKFDIVNFEDLPETPIVDQSIVTKRGFTWNKFKLSIIAGTVVDKNNNNHFISLLTQDGLVGVRYDKGQYAYYNKATSIEENGKKKTIDKSWFGRGDMVVIVGYRRGDEFIPKTYNDSVFEHSTVKIESVDSNGEITFKINKGE